MTEVVHDAREMLAGMTPTLHPQRFVFVQSVGADWARLNPMGMFREAEGVSLILDLATATVEGFAIDAPMALITLNVYSALEGVGLTAAVASVLARGEIACNMVAALRHDHVIVPANQAQTALKILLDLQEKAQISAP